MKQQIKSCTRRAIANLYHWSGLYKTRHNRKVLVLMYHRVLPETTAREEWVQPGMYVTPQVFEMQIRFLKDRFKIISFADLLDGTDSASTNENEARCLITFDDGWHDNYSHAFPILRKYDIPATIFIPTSYIGTEKFFWPDRLNYLIKTLYSPQYSSQRLTLFDKMEIANRLPMDAKKSRPAIDAVIEELKQRSEEEILELIDESMATLNLSPPKQRAFLNWDEIEEMSQNSIAFGSHSLTHKILTTISLNEAEVEITESMRALIEKKVNLAPVFCYPNGNNNSKIRELVSKCGYKAAVTTEYGFASNDPETRFEMKRIGIHNDITSTIPLFSFHLSGLRHALGS